MKRLTAWIVAWAYFLAGIIGVVTLGCYRPSVAFAQELHLRTLAEMEKKQREG